MLIDLLFHHQLSAKFLTPIDVTSKSTTHYKPAEKTKTGFWQLTERLAQANRKRLEVEEENAAGVEVEVFEKPEQKIPKDYGYDAVISLKAARAAAESQAASTLEALQSFSDSSAALQSVVIESSNVISLDDERVARETELASINNDRTAILLALLLAA